MTRIIVNGDKPELVNAMQAMKDSFKILLETGDPEVHKKMTFGDRYGQGQKDPRIFSRDPEVIKEYWRDYFDGKIAAPKPVKLGDLHGSGSDAVGDRTEEFARSVAGLGELLEAGQGRDEGSGDAPPKSPE